MTDELSQTAEILQRAAGGDQLAIDELFIRYRPRLKRMVRLRMNRKLAGRLDESDVVQEALLHATRRLDEYLQDSSLPFYLWLRHLTGLKLLAVHRRHLSAEKRDAAREISLHRGGYPPASSASLAAQLLGRFSSPSQAAIKAEMRSHLQDALNGMDPIDREVLTLRHFEQLGNADVARILEIRESAASKRYTRALERLHKLLAELRLFDRE